MKLLLALLGLAYVICPYDLFPDFFLGPGWIDDLLLLAILWWFFFRKKGLRTQGDFQEYREYGSGRREEGFGKEGAPRRENNEGPENPYSVLGLERNASREEVRQAYRRLAGKYHPDKVAHLGEEFRDLAEERFKEIQRAYQELGRQ